MHRNPHARWRPGLTPLARAYLIDIEGTTSSLEFVKNVLFPYAREHLARFIAERRAEPAIDAALFEAQRLARAEGSADENVLAALQRWMAEDRKVTPLKTLQGLLWDAAFREGTFAAHMYADVAPALSALRQEGLGLYVYSSGSVHAQKAFFRHSTGGDLTPLIDGWFDTSVGSKTDPASYRAIAERVSLEPADITFLSDSVAELDAAREAGLSTVGLLREALRLGAHPALTTFAGLPPRRESREAGKSRGASSAAATLARVEVVELARYCHARGWASATSGNFSVRVAPEQVAITPSGVDKGRVMLCEVLLVNLDGEPLEPGTPSAETPLHTALYRSSPTIGAVGHTHSVAGTVLSRRHAAQGFLRLTAYEMSKALMPASGGALQELVLPIVANSQDTVALARSVSTRLRQAPTLAYLVEGHGLTTAGRSAADVRRHIEALEFMLACELAASHV
jgi:2,3-diketo-5-methylthio-1-phosphopentane phosphatase/methylthioribulose-1-phosphate dehydratase